MNNSIQLKYIPILKSCDGQEPSMMNEMEESYVRRITNDFIDKIFTKIVKK